MSFAWFKRTPIITASASAPSIASGGETSKPSRRTLYSLRKDHFPKISRTCSRNINWDCLTIPIDVKDTEKSLKVVSLTINRNPEFL